MRRPRHLSPDEKALWDQVADRTTPLNPTSPNSQPMDEPPKTLQPKAPKVNNRFTPFKVGATADPTRPHDILPGITERLSKAPVNMDNKAFTRLKRGKLKPEARIDLHGMTMSQAHPALTSFILQSQSVGRRLVLVITGKGKERDDGGPFPARQGVLRHQVPQWFALPPMSQAILQVTPAHIRHGGHGAYYVYLRRNR